MFFNYSRGRFWAGTLEILEKNGPLGALYCMGKDLEMKKKVDLVEISNGICWSIDHKTMYFIDSPTQRVDSFEYNAETAEISNRQTIFETGKDNGYPDGMCIDEQGMLWVAHWGGSRITRWNPNTGKLLQTVMLPISKPTSCCFGGPQLSELYITTASYQCDLEKEPLAGGLFVLRNPGVRGIAELEFDG
jgi:sugar lactone lactonase YvrE